MKTGRKLLITLLLLSLVAAVSVGLSSCGKCAHEWGEWQDSTATCTKDGVRERTCARCGESETEPVAATGHTYSSATCTAAKTCTDCGATDGEALGHKWADATCTAPKSCERCDATEGTSLGDAGHVGGNATCTDRAVCTTCGAQYGDVIEHSFGQGQNVTSVSCLENGEVKYTCSVCNTSKTETVYAEGHNYTAAVTDPTCDEAGYTTYTCSKCGASYTGSETQALGHDWDKAAADCESGRECRRCDAAEPATEHNYTETVTAPTCEDGGYTIHTCTKCKDFYTDTELPALGHSITGVEPTLRPVTGETCVEVEIFACTVCGVGVEGDRVPTHTYKASITTAATCSADGVNTVKCDMCGSSFTETIAKNENAHSWSMGAVIGVKRIDTCGLCGDTKTVTVVEGNVTPETSANDLKDTEIQMDNANISLDNGVIDTLGNKNVTISAEKLEGDDRPDAGLSKDQLAQIGNNPVYNFTMNDGDGNISKFGDDNWVTITIPYELTAGEDVDNIAIWFITDKGELESFRATYSNGYVTFKTNHFSFYTVTRLTPRERCELYGHNYTKTTVTGTCITDGYDLHACIRCADTYKDNVITAPGHQYEAETTPATCLERGVTVYTCHCGHSYKTVLSALGHEYGLEDSLSATCSERGYETWGCIRCDNEYTVTLPKLSHVISSDTVAPTCERFGYTVNACENCDYSYDTDTVPALGHNWTYEWVWADGYVSCELVFTCMNDALHTHSHTAEVTSNRVSGEMEKIEYYAKAVYNGTVYNDTKVEVLGAHTHAYETGKYDAESHWLECNCGDKSGLTAHEWIDGEVTEAPTCVAVGVQSIACSCGATGTKSVPATGKHSYTDGVCSICGAEKKGDFYLNLISTPFTTDGITVTLNDFSYVYERKNNNGVFEMIGSVERTRLTELVINYSEGELFATATGGISIFNGPLEDETVNYSFDLLVEDGYLYIEYRHDMYTAPETGSVKMNFELFMREAFEEIFDIEYEFVDAMRSVWNDVTALAENYGEAKGEEANAMLESLFATVFTVTENGGKYNFTLDYNKLYALNDNLADKTVSEVLDLYLGNGKFESMAADVVKITDTKMQNVPELLSEYGIDADILFKIIEEIAYKTGAAPEFYDVDAMLKSDRVKDKTLAEAIYGSDGKDKVDELLDLLRENTPYTLMYKGHEDDIIKSFDDTVEMLEDALTVGFTADGDGFVTALDAALTELTVNDGSNYRIIYSLGLGVRLGKNEDAKAPEGLKDRVNALTPKYEAEDEEDEFSHSDERYVKYKGEYYYFEGREYIVLKDLDNIEGYVVIPDCGDWNFYQIMHVPNGASYSTGTLYDSDDEMFANVIINNATGEIAIVEMSQDSFKATREDGTVITLTENDVNTMSDIASAIFGKMEYSVRYDAFDSDDLFYNKTTGATSDKSHHDLDTKYVILGTDCDDEGVKISESCRRCGYKYERFHYGHPTEIVNVSLSQYGFCGDIEISECQACGMVTGVYDSDSCRWGTSNYNDGEGVTFFRCAYCNLVKTVERTVSEKDANCRYLETSTYTYFDANGDAVYTVTRDWYNTDHRYQYSFDLYGKSCEDGMMVYESCADCALSESREVEYHYTVYKYVRGEDYGCCEDHRFEIDYCPCGNNFSMYYNNGSLNEEEDGTLSCTRCTWRISEKTVREYKDCVCYETVNVSICVDGEEIFSDKIVRDYAHHDFKVTVTSLSDAKKIRSECRDCGAYTETVEENPNGLAQLEEHDGEYYYDFCFTPEKTAKYEIVSISDMDTYVILFESVNGKLLELTKNDDSYNNSNFQLIYTLEAGKTYVYRIRFYSSDRSGEIPYLFREYVSATDTENTNCSHKNKEWIYSLVGSSCTDGVISAYMCVGCGRINEYYEYDTHELVFEVEHINLETVGACYGDNMDIERCVCGKSTVINRNFNYDNYNYNEYTDEYGRVNYVDTYYCGDCGLRLVSSYYEVLRYADCESDCYYTFNISIGSTLIKQYNYTAVNEVHDDVTTYKLNGNDCNYGVDLTYVCKTCGRRDTQHVGYHQEFVTETIDLKALGAVCDGYAIVVRCACGYYSNVNFDHSQCDFDEKSTDPWISDIVTGRQYTVNGYNYYSYTFSIYTCAVTDPDACGFKIRYSNYWRKTNGCYVTVYKVWEFGYDEETGRCKKRVELSGNKNLYHDYVYTAIDTDTSYGYENRCSECGSIESNIAYYDAYGNRTREEIIRTNTLNNGYNRRYEYIRNYTVRSDGSEYTSREYCRNVYADGSEYWYCNDVTEETYYNAPFGTNAVRRNNSYTNSRGESWLEVKILTYYKGYSFELYRRYEEGNYWYQYDYTYSFANGCYRSYVYNDSKGEHDEGGEAYHRDTYYLNIEAPTCTQDGTAGYKCYVCDRIASEFPVDPIAHEWMYVYDMYYCRYCKLENVNGASGAIVMEDLTSSLGGGTDYVVGYWARNNVQFTYYVSLILNGSGNEVILDGISFSNHSSVRAIVFSKSAVRAAAAKLGYSEDDYLVRFAFVPTASDGSFDYALTFTDDTAPKVVSESASFTADIKAGGSYEFEIDETQDGYWTVFSVSEYDTYGLMTLNRQDQLFSNSNDDSAGYGQFLLEINVKKGDKITVTVFFWSSEISGDVSIVCRFTPAD